MSNGTCKFLGMRDVLKSIYSFEAFLMENFSVCLNEAIVLCMLDQGTERSTKLAQALGVTYSLMSRTLASLEKKGCLSRKIGEVDKREMYFSLTKNGKELLTKIVEGYDFREFVKACKKVG